jgi:SAM-dependent MidA family methyltransferase
MNSATHTLREKILSVLAAKTAIPFSEYLELALYDPELGYYARPGTQVGRNGDFFTSVSVGPMFGQLLAHRFLAWWQENGTPQKWRILEIGAHDGTLAADIARELKTLSPEAWASMEYAIAEPLPRLQALQKEKLTDLVAHFHSVKQLDELASQPLPGIAFGNEILDALTFHLVEFSDKKWQKLYVTARETGELSFLKKDIPPDSQLFAQLSLLRGNFPEGYRTELRTNFPRFLSKISAAISNGMLLFADYGFAAPEYYDTHRSSGTLRTFAAHQAGEDPFESPGEKDITAHVDFTELAKSAISLGFQASSFSNQGSYLTKIATPMILGGALDDPKKIAQFRTLTHPAHLGSSFHVIEFSQTAGTSPEVMHRLALSPEL